MKWRSKLVQQWPTLPFVWRSSQLRKYQDCYRERETGFLNRKIPHCWSRLRQSQSISYRFVGSSRLISLQRLFRGQIEWQTLENHLVHTGTSSYQRTHIMMSPIFILVYSFAVFIFEEAGLSTKTASSENFPPYGTCTNTIAVKLSV